MFGKCKVCAEKNLRIAALSAEIQFLKSLVSVPTRMHETPALQVEADALLSGRDEPILVSDTQSAHFERLESEANRLLSGNY